MSSAKIKCMRCGAQVPGNRLACLECGAIVLGTGSLGKGQDDGVLTLGDVKADAAPRYDMGEPLNLNWGGGLAKLSVSLLGGEPGIGKSTLTLKLLERLAEVTGKRPLYISAEEPSGQLRDRALRLKIKHQDKIDVLPLEKMTDAPPLPEILERRKPGGVILDSLQGFDDDDLAIVEHAKACKKFAAKFECPFVLVAQINAAGDFTGRKKLQHAVDTLLYFEMATEIPRDDGESEYIRTLKTDGKNRFGKSGVVTHWKMTERGIVHVTKGQYWRFDPKLQQVVSDADEEDDEE